MTDLDKIAQNYDPINDFDHVLAFYTARIIAPQLKNQIVLEAGCSTGIITEEILKYAKKIDVLDGSSYYINTIEQKFGERINKTFVSNFENFETPPLYNCIVFAHVIHHIESPLELLIKMKNWLTERGTIYISVPNITSFHRELGVKMNISTSVDDPSERNIFFKQPGRFDKVSLIDLVNRAGFKVVDCYNYFFKPFPHDIMQSLIVNNKINSSHLDGLFLMGKKYEDLACHTYLKGVKL